MLVLSWRGLDQQTGAAIINLETEYFWENFMPLTLGWRFFHARSSARVGQHAQWRSVNESHAPQRSGALRSRRDNLGKTEELFCGPRSTLNLPKQSSGHRGCHATQKRFPFR